VIFPICHRCGHDKPATKYPICRSCAQLTSEARIRNSRSGRRGGVASGVQRRHDRRSGEYVQGYAAGWLAGKKTTQRVGERIW
jgi:hypothetical protein